MSLFRLFFVRSGHAFLVEDGLRRFGWIADLHASFATELSYKMNILALNDVGVYPSYSNMERYSGLSLRCLAI